MPNPSRERRTRAERVCQAISRHAPGTCASHCSGRSRGGRKFVGDDRHALELERVGPAVLGWERWREVAERNGLGLMQGVIHGAVDAGEIAPIAVEPLAHLLMGALDEAALMVVRDPDATDSVAATFERLIDGLQP